MLFSTYLKMHPAFIQQDIIPTKVRKEILKAGEKVTMADLIDKCVVVVVGVDSDKVLYTAAVSKMMPPGTIQKVVEALDVPKIEFDRDTLLASVMSCDPNVATDKSTPAICAALASSLNLQSPGKCLLCTVIISNITGDDIRTSNVNLFVDRSTLSMISSVMNTKK